MDLGFHLVDVRRAHLAACCGIFGVKEEENERRKRWNEELRGLNEFFSSSSSILREIYLPRI